LHDDGSSIYKCSLSVRCVPLHTRNRSELDLITMCIARAQLLYTSRWEQKYTNMESLKFQRWGSYKMRIYDVVILMMIMWFCYNNLLLIVKYIRISCSRMVLLFKHSHNGHVSFYLFHWGDFIKNFTYKVMMFCLSYCILCAHIVPPPFSFVRA
jgi:uncharacterized membrane protein